MTVEVGPGSVVHRYRLERLLGKGGMGSVWEATPLDGGERVAIKTMHPEVAERPTYRKRFLREARAAMAVPHDSIVRIREVFEHEGTPMLAMELLDGESLEQLVEREGPLPLDRLARILVHVASALGTAHTLGIVHRDMKPENVFLCRDGTVKVVDFGIAKLKATDGLAAETQALTKTGALMGTPFYMSPEQAFGDKLIDQRADIWSLGILMYRCLSGIVPTKAATFGEVFRLVVAGEYEPIEHLVPDLPADVASLVARMLKKIPDERPWDLREVHQIVERHAHESAPTFGEAVAPIVEETTGEGTPAPEPPPDAPAARATPLALTPAAMKLAPRPTGTTPTGTVTMDPPVQTVAEAPEAATLLQKIAPPPSGDASPTKASGPPVGVVVAVVVGLAAVAVVLWRLLG